MELILASASPRRKEILKREGFVFTVISSDFDESEKCETPRKTVESFALGKAKSVFDRLPDKKNKIVLGADTVVVYDGKIIGKPENSARAKKTLETLSGKTHEVYTGYCLISEKETIIGSDLSEVTFNKLSADLIQKYIDSGKPLDKAGSYGIQDGYPIVKSYKGSLDNVIGLPIEKIKPLLISAGIKPQNKTP